MIRAGHRQAVELIRSTTGTLRLTATSVVTPKKTSGIYSDLKWILNLWSDTKPYIFSRFLVANRRHTFALEILRMSQN